MGSIDESIYYGVYGTKITWDVGWIPVSRLRGSSYYSESWLLRNDVNSSMEKLKEELEELDSQINVCDRQIEESLQEILESQQMDDLKESDINDLKPSNLEDPNVFLENAQNVKIHLEVTFKSWGLTPPMDPILTPLETIGPEEECTG
ncbi:hypothetical protein OJ252_2522 [Cryptosporidium canis]|uniref:Uncharacterized protein n=1 Tax=Cryptosporidium canis TaxID=195482 RepID=A0ABQ8P515_9CRYT|nr:hypothetical protein OJ252_2522 [Cryptosporidium canis]